MRAHRLTPADVATARGAAALLNDVFEVRGSDLPEEYAARLLRDPRFWMVVAIEDEQLVGALTAHELPMTREATSEIFIYDLAVRSDSRRRGIGRALVDHVLATADRTSVSSVFVPADDDDTHALAFYRAVGGQPAAVTMFDLDLTTPPGGTGRS